MTCTQKCWRIIWSLPLQVWTVSDWQERESQTDYHCHQPDWFLRNLSCIKDWQCYSCTICILYWMYVWYLEVESNSNQYYLYLSYLLWALSDDDSGGRATTWTRFTWCFDLIGESITAAHILKHKFKKNAYTNVRVKQRYGKLYYCAPIPLHLSSSVSVGTLLYHSRKASSEMKTQFLQEDWRSRIWAKTSNSCKKQNHLSLSLHTVYIHICL